MKDNRFKLYINSQNKDVLKAIEYAKSKGLNPSSYLCSCILKSHAEEIKHPMAEPIPEPVVQEKNHIILDLVELAKEYERVGVDGLDISYILPYFLNHSDIKREDVVDLLVFCVKVYDTIVNVEEIKNIILNNPDKLPRSKRDIQSKIKLYDFRKLLNTELLTDVERKIKNDELKKKEELEERNKKLAKLNLEKLNLEKKQWEILNPQVPFWAKDRTAEEIELSNKLFSGEWEIVESEDDN